MASTFIVEIGVFAAMFDRPAYRSAGSAAPGFAADTTAATEEKRQLLGGRGRGALLNQQVQLVQIDRFDQMMFEACFVTLADVVFHPKTG